MVKYIRRKAAEECPVHQKVFEKAKERIEHIGWFGKELLLRKIGLYAMADSIRWDYIVEFLNKDLDTELVPVVSQFGKSIQNDQEDIEKFPWRYIASGHGKKTWGYANAEEMNGVLAVRRLSQRNAQAEGAVNAVTRIRKKMTKKGLLANDKIPRIKK